MRGLSRSMIGFTRGDWILTFFLAIFVLNDFCMKVDVVAISAFAGSNVTMPCMAIGDSLFNNSCFGLLLERGCFWCKRFQTWLYSKYYEQMIISSIIILLQYPTASLTNITNYINFNYDWKRYLFWMSFLATNIKLYVKGDQVYMCNIQPWSFPDCISSCTLRYVDIYIYITWHILYVLHINKFCDMWIIRCNNVTYMHECHL